MQNFGGLDCLCHLIKERGVLNLISSICCEQSSSWGQREAVFLEIQSAVAQTTICMHLGNVKLPGCLEIFL